MDENVSVEPVLGLEETELGERKRRARRREVQDDDVPTGPIARREPERQLRALELSRICARIADDNRGKDVLLIDLSATSPLFDFFVIATAPSRRQAATIISDVDAEMKKRQEFKVGSEGTEEGRWALVDYGDFVVHVFSDDARSFYALEDIWGHAPRLEWRDPSRPAPVATIEIHESDADEVE